MIKKGADGVPQLTTGGQKTLFYSGIGIITLVLAAPLLAVAAGAIANLVVIAGYGVVLWAAWMARTWFVLKWKNTVLKLLKAEARRNPIETLQNEYLTRKSRFEEARARVRQLTATRNSLGEKLQLFVQKHGRDDENLRKMFDGLSKLIDRLQNNLSTANKKLEEFRTNLEYQSDRYKIAVETGNLAAELRQATGDTDPLQQFLHDEAIDAVRDEFNRSMADINDLLLEDQVVPQLVQSDETDLIKLEPIRIDDLEPEFVEVPSRGG